MNVENVVRARGVLSAVLRYRGKRCKIYIAGAYNILNICPGDGGNGVFPPPRAWCPHRARTAVVVIIPSDGARRAPKIYAVIFGLFPCYSDQEIINLLVIS